MRFPFEWQRKVQVIPALVLVTDFQHGSIGTHSGKGPVFGVLKKGIAYF